MNKMVINVTGNLSRPLKGMFNNMFCLLLTGLVYLWDPAGARAQNVGLDWVKQIGSEEFRSFSDEGFSIATDHEGNVITTGYYTGDRVDLDPGLNSADTFYVNASTALYSNGTFISKLNSAGAFVWAKSVLARQGTGVATDKDDNIYVTGIFEGTVDFNPGQGVYNLSYLGLWQSSFVLKLNAQGEFLWAKKIEEASTSDIAVDNFGNSYVTGHVGAVNFVSKYDTAGNLVLHKEFGGAVSLFSAEDIALDSLNNMFVTGYFSGMVDFDPGPSSFNLSTGDAVHIFVLKLDASGNFAWAKAMGSPNIPGYVTINMGSGIKVDAWNNVLVTGNFKQTVDFNLGNTPPMLLTTLTPGAAFILKMRNNGDVVWAKRIDHAFGYDIGADNGGNIYTTGVFTDATDFDPGPGVVMHTSFGGTDVYINKFDSAGNYIWSKQMGGYSAEVAQALVVDKSRNIYSTGFFQGISDYDPGPDTVLISTDTIGATGLYDVYIHKLVCRDTSSSHLVVSTCETPYLFNDMVYHQSGIYKQVIPNAAGCDSTINLDLTISPVDHPYITVNVFILGTTGTYTTYQWMLNGVPIPGATNSTYTVSINGDYTVAVTGDHNCPDTSEIYTVTNVTGIEDVANIGRQIIIYPNPAHDRVYVKSPVHVNLLLTTIDGRRILAIDNASSISLDDLSKGIYFLRVLDKEGRLIKVEKLLKE